MSTAGTPAGSRLKLILEGLMIAVITSRWFCTLNLLFMSEKRYQRTMAELREQGRAFGLPADETGRSH